MQIISDSVFYVGSEAESKQVHRGNNRKRKVRRRDPVVHSNGFFFPSPFRVSIYAT